MGKFNALDAMISSAYLNFEDEDLPIIYQTETALLLLYGTERLRELGPGGCAILLTLATIWYSFPANASASDYVVSAHALRIAATDILCSAWEPSATFPYPSDVMLGAAARTKEAARAGDTQSLQDLLDAAFTLVRTEAADIGNSSCNSGCCYLQHARHAGAYSVLIWYRMAKLSHAFDGRCACCGIRGPVTVDHIKPLS